MADVDLDDVEDAIREYPDPVVKANEISDQLGCTSRHVLDLLRLLERAGAVESKEIGARAVAWWHVDRVINEGSTNESRDFNESITNEQPTNNEQTNQQENSEGITKEIEQAVDQAAEQWDDPPDRIEQRKQAARAALEAIRERPMRKSDILDKIEPKHSVDGQSPRTWWRANLSECSPSPLKELASYSNATKKWEWVGE